MQDVSTKLEAEFHKTLMLQQRARQGFLHAR